MFYGETMIESGLFLLHFIQGADRQLKTKIAGTVHMDSKSCLPVVPGGCFKFLGRHQPLTMMPIKVTRLMQHRQL